MTDKIEIPKDDLWELTFKHFKKLVIAVFLKYTPFTKRALKHKVLRFKDEKAKDYYKCACYHCYFNYMGIEHCLWLGYPPLTIMIRENRMYQLEEYRAIPRYEDIEECVKDFIESKHI